MAESIENFYPKSFEDIDTVKKRLKESKDEWLEKKPSQGNATYMSHNTIRQILDNAVKGITYWDFTILEQWKEEIFSFNKNTNSYYFDGYVYHVKGSMFIPGIGRREQYGSKPGIGGKTNQDSAYKAAASNCFNKCASLFGVGEEIYSKIKVEGEEENMQYMEAPPMQQNQMQPNQMQQGWGGQQMNNQGQPFNQNQNSFQPPNQQQGNFQNNQMQQGAFQPNGNFNQGQHENQAAVVDQNPTLEQSMLEVDQMMQNGQVKDVPFMNQGLNQEAQMQNVTTTEQPEAEQQKYTAEQVQYGAPVEDQNKNKATEENKNASDKENQGTNPWQEQGVIQELQNYAEHKKRLNISDDSFMTPYLRDFFKDENATTELLNPNNLKEFNSYLQNISV